MSEATDSDFCEHGWDLKLHCRECRLNEEEQGELFEDPDMALLAAMNLSGPPMGMQRGLDPVSPKLAFVKDSQRMNKTMMALVEPSHIDAMARVLTFGANKYGKGNWKTCEDTSLYLDALLRHISAWRDPNQSNFDDGDGGTGENHLVNAAVNLMFLAHFEESKDEG